jgi:hypothetical protein
MSKSVNIAEVESTLKPEKDITKHHQKKRGHTQKVGRLTIRHKLSNW